MKSHNIAARTFGIAFLIGYLSYGFGFGLFNFATLTSESLSTIFASRNQLIFEAAVMMALFAPVNIMLAVIMLPIFKRFNQCLSYGYLSAAIASTVLLIVGAIFLLLLIPLSESYLKADQADVSYYELLFDLCKKANFYAYQIAMFVWGLGGLIFAYLLYVSRLVPRWLSLWGIVGYVIFIAGAVFALFGISIDVLLDIPGGLFELFLSFWFIFKGFALPVLPTKA